MTSPEEIRAPLGDVMESPSASVVPLVTPSSSSNRSLMVTPRVCVRACEEECGGDCGGVDRLTGGPSAESTSASAANNNFTGRFTNPGSECRAVASVASTKNTLSPLYNATATNNNLIPRSSSDIPAGGSSLGSLSQQGSDDVSSDTSRASAGASLEKFFTQMGMEPEVLDPLLQFQHRRDGNMASSHSSGARIGETSTATSGPTAVFESLSSLDSYESRSITSLLSRSEKGAISDNESLGGGGGGEDDMQSTASTSAAVERDARIIKWLCNVKKAKAPAAPRSSGLGAGGGGGGSGVGQSDSGENSSSGANS